MVPVAPGLWAEEARAPFWETTAKVYAVLGASPTAVTVPQSAAV